MIPLRDNIPARRFPIVNYALIAINAYVFLHEVFLPGPELAQWIRHWGVVPARFFHSGHEYFAGYPRGAVWTLFTYMFLHGGWFHVISNLWALWLFGDNVEDRLGHARYLFFYILCGLAAALLQIVLHSRSVVPTVGASGAIAGVMGAYFLFFPFARMLVMVPVFFYPLLFEIPAALYLLLWIISQLFSGTFALAFGAGAVGGVAFWAHIGGFFSGMYLGWRWRGASSRRTPRWERAEQFPV